jgi:hypothetical protein
MPIDTELQSRVTAIVADVLGYEPHELSAEQNFFHIRAAFQHMTSGNRWELDGDGRFTAATRTQLAQEFPFLKPKLEATSFQTPYDLLTVGHIVEFVALAESKALAAKG